MEGKRLIETIRLTNFLSYGPAGEEVALEPLNVLIGPNASGKSNLIEAIGLLSTTPKDLTVPIREGGGISDWLWKGKRKQPSSTRGSIAGIKAIVDYPPGPIYPGGGPMPLSYILAFGGIRERFHLIGEYVENAYPMRDGLRADSFYNYVIGTAAVLSVRSTADEPEGTSAGRSERSLKEEELNRRQSVLSQIKDWVQYPELTYLGNQFAAIKLYREWNLGRYTQCRVPQKADLPEDFLLEDGSNLALVLNDLEHRGGKQLIIEKLKVFYENLQNYSTRVHGGTVQLFFHEKHLSQPVPATRLSDGTLRYLCLLTLLCHPEPPPLVCIEEPELGLHPDILPTIADLLIDASQRTQLVVTTHSDILVSALTEVPESVLVCEQDQDGSHLKRLEREKLKTWLEKYTLGELWTMGEIGGTRW